MRRRERRRAARRKPLPPLAAPVSAVVGPVSWPLVIAAPTPRELAAAKRREEQEAKAKGATIVWGAHTVSGDARPNGKR
jgi:hypothetical protein